ncbi:hypothetical protein [Streptomyces canus]|uniref:hypothetical protein n=1 Tax=Streptomyces canus TaxID=58343 RepID=UPI00386DEB77|nr:hypothetical protein OH824_17750 [Streptomyces canus]
MGIFGRREPETVDKAAAKVRERGDTVYVRVVHALPGKQDGGLAQRITLIEAAGWQLEHQQEGVRVDHGYRQRYWTLTFRAVDAA